jgi:excinuclease ABC subunit C
MAEEIRFNIEEELKKLPTRPGVYIMHDKKDAIIYVGKAISLRNRVRQYFQTSRNKGPKIEQMVADYRRSVNFVDIDEIMYKHIHSSVRFLQEMAL